MQTCFCADLFLCRPVSAQTAICSDGAGSIRGPSLWVLASDPGADDLHPEEDAADLDALLQLIEIGGRELAAVGDVEQQALELIENFGDALLAGAPRGMTVEAVVRQQLLDARIPRR